MRATLLILILALSFPARAAFVSCEAERTSYCPDQKTLEAVLMCLYAKLPSLSSVCKQELQRIGKAKKQADEDAGGTLTSFGGMGFLGPPVPMVAYNGRFSPQSGGGMQQIENRLNASFPVYKDAGDTVSVSLDAGVVDFGEPTLLTTGRTTSRDWTRLEIGVQYAHQMEGLKNWSVKGAIGYAGDEPSRIPRDQSFSVVGTYGFPGRGTDYWLLMVFIGNNTQFANYVPLPGVVYVYRTEHFTGAFGFPILSLQWTPVNRWMFSLSLLALTGQAEITYGSLRQGQFFLGYGYFQQSYIPSLRLNNSDRLFIHDQKAGPGFRQALTKRFLVETQLGWSFDRTVTVGSSFFNRAGGWAGFDPTWFARLAVKYAL